MPELAVALATVAAFARGSGAERVVVLFDVDPERPPLMLERTEDGVLEVTDGESTRRVAPSPAAPLALPALRAVPASALHADPETGELAAPLGSVQLLADSVLALARAFGGRSVATATFATRDPEVPVTVAARDGEPVVLDLAGRQFTLPA
jgi:hypothetical protein